MFKTKVNCSLFFTQCIGCALPLTGQQGLCPTCQASLPTSDGICLACGHLLRPHRNCKHCSSSTELSAAGTSGHSPLSAYYMPWRYRYPVRQMIQSAKYDRKIYVFKALAQAALPLLLAQRNDAPLPDLLIPIPMSPAKQQARGFNQAEAISAIFSAALGIPYQTGLNRQGKQQTQAGLTRAERLGNLNNAFILGQPLNCSRIALIDDVVTTGATLTAAAQVIHKAHPKVTIEGWALARTPALS